MPFTLTCKLCGKDFVSHFSRRLKYCDDGCSRKIGQLYSRTARASWSLERKRAGWLVQNAICKGRLVRQPCEVCGTRRYVDAHHDDYTKPLDVRWLCRSHHQLHHVTLRKAA